MSNANASTVQPLHASADEQRYDQAMQEALRCTDTQDFAGAQTQLAEAMRISPASAVPHFLLAANFAQQGDSQEAEAQFIQCLLRDPTFALARFQLGLLQLTNGRGSVAMATWDPLLASVEDTYLKRFAQGFQEILLGNRASAERFFREGMSRNTGLPLLNRDIEGVLGRLAAMPGSQAESGAAGLPEEVQETAHFLVGAYRQA